MLHAISNNSLILTLHPIPSLDPLTIEFALEVRRDPQLSTAPHAVHLMGEMGGEFG
jgi:hypothetical protein